VLHALQAVGVPVYNDGRAIERSVDKAVTNLLLARAGLPVPPTWVMRDPESAGAVIRKEHMAGHALICKPLFGSQGKGIARIEPGDNLPGSDDYNGVYYLQRYIDSGEGHWHDWRVFVIGGQAVAAMRRDGNTWVSNVAQGARGQAAVLDETMSSLAEAAVAAVDMQYAGVDLLQDVEGRWWLIELNSIPAWKALQGVCRPDIAQALADDFLAQMAGGKPLEVVG
jgi:tetrahydromethanopterin:alpha-L-glutamate ligase